MLRRLAIGVVLVIGVSLLVFAGTQVLPGDAASAVLGRTATPEALTALRAEMGLDQSLVMQYLGWLGGLITGDFGTSIATQQPVSVFVEDRLFNTLVLAAVTLAVLMPLSLLLGVWSGVRKGTGVDRVISVLTLSFIALPEFVTGALLALLFAVTLKMLPAVSLVAPGANPLATPEVLVLPVVALLLAGLAYNVRMIRAGVADVMESEYVQSARLNGVPERRVIWRHALRNALAPSVQVAALTVQWLVGGVVLVEYVFQYPGLGQGLVNAVTSRDIPVVQSVAMGIAAVYIAINIVADLIVVMAIPKLRTTVR